MSILLRNWLVGAPCCCPSMLAGPLDAGRFPRHWPVPSTLASPLDAGWSPWFCGPLDAGQSPRRWPVPSTLAGSLDAGRFPGCWLVPSMLAGSLNNGWSPRCWCHMLVLLRSPADASYCKSPLLLFILCYSFVVVYEYTFMYKMYKINKFARYK